MSTVIENYEFLSDIMGQMRAAATQGEWDHLVELEKKCSERVNVMKAQDAAAPVDEPTRLRKVALIRKILADDAEIRNRTQPWMAQLQGMLQSVHKERRLAEAYFGKS